MSKIQFNVLNHIMIIKFIIIIITVIIIFFFFFTIENGK